MKTRHNNTVGESLSSLRNSWVKQKKIIRKEIHSLKPQLTNLGQQTHMLNPTTGKYNLFFIKRWNIFENWALAWALRQVSTNFKDSASFRQHCQTTMQLEITTIRLTLCLCGKMKNGVRNCKIFCTPSELLFGIINSQRSMWQTKMSQIGKQLLSGSISTPVDQSPPNVQVAVSRFCFLPFQNSSPL